ncbi:DUF72 domain-containing protein [bacterium]|nr:DUF72 domain-containing protein [bacterium]
MPKRILIGTSGFSYDDWKGTWYPPDLSKKDMLGFYSDVFDALELNVTYYRTPPPRSAESILEKSKRRLAFSIKAPGELTHRREIGRSVIEPFRDFLQPFRETGTLSALLFQFPYAFHASPATWDFLSRIRDAFPDDPIVVEMRHNSWDNARADVQLSALQFSRAILDQPDVSKLSASARESVTGPIAYFRFHGRNRDAWFQHEEMSDRYRYDYSKKELEEWVPRVRESSEKAQSTMVFFNNHPDGNAPKDAEDLAGLLGQPLRGSGYSDLFS